MTGTKQVMILAVGLLVATASAATAQRPGSRHLLTGTYQLDLNQGDDARRAAQQAASAVSPDQRDRTYQSLLARLEAPDQIAIERQANSVTMASTRAARVRFDADGLDHQEEWSAGRSMNTRATLDGERLVVATTGYRGSDFTVTFDPMNDGRSLYMTRTIDDERLSQPVTVRSSYRRVSDEARWDIETVGTPGPSPNTVEPGRDVSVPDGTRFVGVLDNDLTTASAREGDFYTMTIQSPSQYAGAVIQGSVSSVNDSGRMRGRAGVMLNLQNIRFRNGQSSQFDGIILDVRTPDGDTIRVNREGGVDNRDGQSQKIVERSVFGAALGAIIGAVAGGGKGAAIGAAIGAGGGAGTVMIEGRDRLDLPRGTAMTIMSGDPRRQ